MKIHECWITDKDYNVGECGECKWIMVSIYRNYKVCFCSLLEIDVFKDQLMNCEEFVRGATCDE